MIRIARPPVGPRNLKGKGQTREARDCAAFDADSEKYVSGEWTFLYDEKIYTAGAVKRLLLEIHHCKCCYCEQKFTAPALDVEHFSRRVQSNKMWTTLLRSRVTTGSLIDGRIFYYPVMRVTERIRRHCFR